MWAVKDILALMGGLMIGVLKLTLFLFVGVLVAVVLTGLTTNPIGGLVLFVLCGAAFFVAFASYTDNNRR